MQEKTGEDIKIVSHTIENTQNTNATKTATGNLIQNTENSKQGITLGYRRGFREKSGERWMQTQARPVGEGANPPPPPRTSARAFVPCID